VFNNTRHESPIRRRAGGNNSSVSASVIHFGSVVDQNFSSVGNKLAGSPIPPMRRAWENARRFNRDQTESATFVAEK
jgi:hypothetical protein